MGSTGDGLVASEDAICRCLTLWGVLGIFFLSELGEFALPRIWRIGEIACEILLICCLSVACRAINRAHSSFSFFSARYAAFSVGLRLDRLLSYVELVAKSTSTLHSEGEIYISLFHIAPDVSVPLSIGPLHRFSVPPT